MIETPQTPSSFEPMNPPSRALRRGRPPLDPTFQRDRILSAAIDIFIDKGFAGSSVHAIGKAAGVTKRTIYELIGDKEALFHAACERLRTSTRLSHFDLPPRDKPVRDVLLDMANRIVAAALAPEIIAYNRMLVVETIRFPQLVQTAVERSRFTIHVAIAQVFAELMSNGSIATGDASAAADTFYDSVVGARAIRAVLGFNERPPAQAELESRVDMVLRGYLQRGI